MRPFEGCWHRIERAQAHCDALSEAWNSFLETEAYTTIVRVNDNGTGGLWISPKYATFPPGFSLELGEMLYELRAALDGSIYEAAILQSGKNPPPDQSQLEFPICPTAAAFKKARRNIRPLSVNLQRFIESVQPYNAPELVAEQRVMNFNRTLGILHEWARIDRHRQLHIIGSWVSNASPKFRLPKGVNLVSMVVSGTSFLEYESEIATFTLDGFIPGMKVDANPDVMIDISLNEAPPPCADNDTLGNRLIAMMVAARTIIAAIEVSFES